MPIYEYKCEKCNEHLEVLQKIGEKALTRCKKCKGKLHKVISKSSFQLKGSGWYVTDYAKGSGAPQSDTDTPTKAEPKAEPAPATAACGPAGSGKSD